jgi:hypothetical protein
MTGGDPRGAHAARAAAYDKQIGIEAIHAWAQFFGPV